MAEHAPGDARRSWAMAVDLERCTGCWACSVACALHYGVLQGSFWNPVANLSGDALDVPTGTYPDLDLLQIPVGCQHCQDPPCLKVCPTGATYQRQDGIVAMDYALCNGCRACLSACPYAARIWVEAGARRPTAPAGDRPGGVAEKCGFCMERVDAGLPPVCVEACAQGARTFGDLGDPGSPISRLLAERGHFQLLPELGTNPRIYYLEARERGPQGA